MAKNVALWLVLGAGAGLGAIYFIKKKKSDETKAQAVAKVVAPKAPITGGIVPPHLAKLKKPIGILPPHLRFYKAQGNYFSLG